MRGDFMGESAYYNIYVMVTVGAAIVGISLYLLRTGESYIKRYLNIGGDYSQSSSVFVRFLAQIASSFVITGIIYSMIFPKHTKNAIDYSNIPQYFHLFVLLIIIFWMIELEIINRFDDFVKWTQPVLLVIFTPHFLP